MSTRKIKHWGKNAGEAFGHTGYKGMKGEHWFADYYRKKGFKVELFESSRAQQCTGIDVILSAESCTYTIDVKNNLKADNSFYVETNDTGWLFNPKYKNDYVSHVNPSTGVIATYIRKLMQRYIEERYKSYPNTLVQLHKDNEGLGFISWTFTEK